MRFNRGGINNWLMVVIIAILMIAAGLSSTDKGWAIIGGVILAVALLIGAIEVYGWTRKSQGKSTELPTPVVVVLCVIAIPPLGVYGFATGNVEALLVAGVLIVLLVLLFLLRNTPPIKLGEIKISREIPVRTGEQTSTVPADVVIKTELPLGKEGNYLRGIFHAVRGDTDAALEAFRISASHAGASDEEVAQAEGALALGRAVALVSGRRYEEALAELDGSLAESPTADARMLRGHVLLTIGATEEALADIEAAAKDRSVPGVKGMLGAAYLEAGRLDEAVNALKEASTETTATSGTLFTLAEAYRLSGRDTEAHEAYDDAAARAIVDFQYATAANHGILPLALARQGKPDKAEEAIQQLTATAPDDPSLRIARAVIGAGRDAPVFAAQDLEEALRVNPHAVVKALEDPEFAPLQSMEAYQALLKQAKEERGGVLARVRARSGA